MQRMLKGSVWLFLVFFTLCHLWFLRTQKYRAFFSSHTVVLFTGRTMEQFRWWKSAESRSSRRLPCPAGNSGNLSEQPLHFPTVLLYLQ